EPAVDAALAGEPEHPLRVEGGRVEISAAALGWERESDDFARDRIDTHDGVLAAIGDPRRAIKADDHAVRSGWAAQGDLLHLAGRRVQPPQFPDRLGGVPDAAVGRG